MCRCKSEAKEEICWIRVDADGQTRTTEKSFVDGGKKYRWGDFTRSLVRDVQKIHQETHELKYKDTDGRQPEALTLDPEYAPFFEHRCL